MCTGMASFEQASSIWVSSPFRTLRREGAFWTGGRTAAFHFGFHDLRSGLFVDQKWVDLAPCFFDEIHILRHAGCNVAYWNLRERFLSDADNRVVVNGDTPLVFFHYSGYRTDRPDQLSSKLGLPQHVDETLRRLLVFYGQRLQANGAAFYDRNYGAIAMRKPSPTA